MSWTESWTDKEVERVKDLLGEEKSAEIIARTLNAEFNTGRTRSAVLGMVYRRKLRDQVKSKKSAKPPASSAAAPPPAESTDSANKPQTEQELDEIVAKFHTGTNCPVWSEAPSACLQELYAVVQRDETIASCMNRAFPQNGGYSEHAVYRQRQRLGLSKGKAVRRPVAAPAQPASKIPHHPTSQWHRDPEKVTSTLSAGDTQLRETVGEIDCDAKRVSLFELTERTCKWPIGDPDHEDFHFCGHESVSGKPYCARHCQVAYQADSPKKSRSRKIRGGFQF